MENKEYRTKREYLKSTIKELEEEIERNEFLIIQLKGNLKILDITFMGGN